MEKNFEETVKAMSAKEIIMSMVEGLQNPKVKVDMNTFGIVSQGVCYGCAATNTVCKISNKIFDEVNIWGHNNRAEFIETNSIFLDYFEEAINELRQGEIYAYNFFAKQGGFALIKRPSFKNLPFLFSHYSHKELQEYIDLANEQ